MENFFGTGSGGYQWPVLENLPTSSDSENAQNRFQSGNWLDDMATWTGTNNSNFPTFGNRPNVNPNCPIHGNQQGNYPGNSSSSGRSASVGSAPPNNSPYYAGVPAAAAAARAAIERSLGATAGGMVATAGGMVANAIGLGGIGRGSGATGRPNQSSGRRPDAGGNASASARARPGGEPSSGRPSNPYADYIASSNAARSGQQGSTASGGSSNWSQDQYNHYFGSRPSQGSSGARPRVGSAPRPASYSSGSGSSRIRVIKACPPRG